jgi:hypothetical protein
MKRKRRKQVKMEVRGRRARQGISKSQKELNRDRLIKQNEVPGARWESLKYYSIWNFSIL